MTLGPDGMPSNPFTDMNALNAAQKATASQVMAGLEMMSDAEYLLVCTALQKAIDDKKSLAELMAIIVNVVNTGTKILGSLLIL